MLYLPTKHTTILSANVVTWVSSGCAQETSVYLQVKHGKTGLNLESLLIKHVNSFRLQQLTLWSEDIILSESKSCAAGHHDSDDLDVLLDVFLFLADQPEAVQDHPPSYR